MKKVSLQILKHTLRDIHKNTESRRFCFIIGAGASFKSGIPTGGQLAQKWFEDLRERYEPSEIEDWIREVGLDVEDLAAHYGAIYRKRFESDKTSGYEFLVQAMRDAKPTFGHFVLAQILSKTQGNCVLTTNFDSLVESAIYQFTDKTPLVCGHESLSGYARPSNIHPLIVKIHRDLLLSPKSDITEISQLEKGWVEPLDNIFSSHIPIVIGYGGNDGSLMAYFEGMNKPSNFFWCIHNGSSPSVRVIKLVEKMEGSFVEIDGFDEMMKELLWVFDEIKPVREELDAVTRGRIESMTKQLEDIDAQPDKSDSNEGKVKKEISAFEYASKAEGEIDLDKKKEIYMEAVTKFPMTAWLWGMLAYFLHFEKKDYSNLEEYYLKALSIDPESANINGNYAIFLNDIKKDYDNAERHYLKALVIDPDSATFNGNYAVFLSDMKHDYDNAEKYYLKALALDPENARNVRNYADFLSDIKKDFRNAEWYYLKALALDPESSGLNGNYAIYLCEIKKDFDNAEKYFRKALAVDPESPSVNGNYAVFLKDIKKDYDIAEKYFLKAISVDPKNPDHLGSYAIYLSDIRKDYDKAEKYYLEALSYNPEHGNNSGNYARLLLCMNRKSEANKYLDLAFEINDDNRTGLLVELWFYRYAHYPESIEESEKVLEDLIKDGITSPGWNFEFNIETAIASGHPYPEKLKEFARTITQ